MHSSPLVENASPVKIDSLRFDTSGWISNLDRHPARLRVWETAEHDAVSLNYFDSPPELPIPATIDALKYFYAAQLGSDPQSKLVECEFQTIADCPAIRVITRSHQAPSGARYDGILTIPFKDFTYVIKVKSPETGTTGVREAVLTASRMATGEIPNLTGHGPVFEGWNPDAPDFDTAFPAHPISRLRKLLAHIASSALVDDAVRAAQPFGLASA
jgi:hypothetical protein